MNRTPPSRLRLPASPPVFGTGPTFEHTKQTLQETT